MSTINPNDINLHPFAATILFHLEGKRVEVYCGDSRTSLLQADAELSQKHVIRGVVIDAMGDCVMLLCESGGKTGTVFINVWSIKTIIPWNDGLFMTDIYEEEHEMRGRRGR